MTGRSRLLIEHGGVWNVTGNHLWHESNWHWMRSTLKSAAPDVIIWSDEMLVICQCEMLGIEGTGTRTVKFIGANFIVGSLLFKNALKQCIFNRCSICPFLIALVLRSTLLRGLIKLNHGNGGFMGCFFQLQHDRFTSINESAVFLQQSGGSVVLSLKKIYIYLIIQIIWV